MEYKFYGQINFDDYMKFRKISLRNTFFLRVLFFCIFICYTIFNTDFTNGISLREIVIAMSFLSLLIIFSIISNSKRYYRKLFESNESFSKKYDYIITEESIIVNSEGNSPIILNKENIYKIIFDKDSIYIFKTKNNAIIIKKRYFNDEEKYNNLVLFINKEYKKKKK